MGTIILDYIKVIGGFLFSWPAIALLAVVVWRNELGPATERLVGFLTGLRKGKIGPVQFEAFDDLVKRGHSSLSTVEKLNVEIAKSRIVELEITQHLLPNGASLFTDQIKNLKRLIGDLEKTDVHPEQ